MAFRQAFNVLEHRIKVFASLPLSSRTGLLDLDPVAPYADALAWADLPADVLAELVVAGTEAGRSDGVALPGSQGAVLTVAGHDHLVAGVGVGVIAPGDVLDSCGTAEALVRVAPPQDAAARRRSAQAGVTVGWHVAEAPGAAGRAVVGLAALGARRSRDRRGRSKGSVRARSPSLPVTRPRSSWSALLERSRGACPPRRPPCGARRSMLIAREVER
jgi:hypothetical protein